MKKFIYEYKALRGRTEIKSSTFEKATIQRISSCARDQDIRTREYIRDLEEFQARRTQEKRTDRHSMSEHYKNDLKEFQNRRSKKLTDAQRKCRGRINFPCTSSCIPSDESTAYEKKIPKKTQNTKGKSSSSTSVTDHSTETPTASTSRTELRRLENYERLHQNEDNNLREADSNSTLRVTASEVDVTIKTDSPWSFGTWGSLPVQIKKKGAVEETILRSCIHPNIIPLLGIFVDIRKQKYIITERCIDSLYTIIHDQERKPSIKTSACFVLDITNALIFMRMRGYIHTKINSASIMITNYDTAKLADLSSCIRVKKHKPDFTKIEPVYTNTLGASRSNKELDCQPLLTPDSSEEYLLENSTKISNYAYKNCAEYKWLAPELFAPDPDGYVNVCSKTDVYSLSLVLWEVFNAKIPWASLSYSELEFNYVVKKTGVDLPADGTYPGAVLSLLQQGLDLNKRSRSDILAFHRNLQTTMDNLDKIDDFFKPKCATYHNSSSIIQYIGPENCVYEDVNNISITPPHNYADVVHCSTSLGQARNNNSIMSPQLEEIPASNASLILGKCIFPLQNSYEQLTRPFITGEPEKENLDNLDSHIELLNQMKELNLDQIPSDVRDEGAKSTSAYKCYINDFSLPSYVIAKNNLILKNSWFSNQPESTAIRSSNCYNNVDFKTPPQKIIAPPGGVADKVAYINKCKSLRQNKGKNNVTRSLECLQKAAHVTRLLQNYEHIKTHLWPVDQSNETETSPLLRSDNATEKTQTEGKWK